MKGSEEIIFSLYSIPEHFVAVACQKLLKDSWKARQCQEQTEYQPMSTNSN